MIATGSYSAPFDEKPQSPDSVCSSAPFLLLVFFLPCPDSSKEAGLVRTHMQGFCRAGLFWKSWVYFFCEVVKHELKMRLEFCYHIVVLALNNKKLDLFKFLQMPFTSQPTAYFYATFLLSNTPTPFCR